MKPPPTVIAAIDIGTNSAHLAVARCDENGVTVLAKHKVVLRLGDALDAERNLTDESAVRTVSALLEMKGVAHPFSPTYCVVATHAVRSAKNREAFVNRVFNETGLSVKVIDGLEEARLVSLGMRLGLPLGGQSFMGADIGGGSTELVFCDARGVHSAFSLHMGSVMLARDFLGAKAWKKVQIAAVEDAIAKTLTPLQHTLALQAFGTAVVCSGAAKALAFMVEGSSSIAANGYLLYLPAIEVVYRRLTELRSVVRIEREWNLDRNRAEIILPGVAILLAISRVMKIEVWTVSTYGLREGLIVDASRQNKERSGA